MDGGNSQSRDFGVELNDAEQGWSASENFARTGSGRSGSGVADEIINLLKGKDNAFRRLVGSDEYEVLNSDMMKRNFKQY